MEESGASDAEEPAWSLVDEWLISQTAPLNLLSTRCALSTTHLVLADLVPTILHRGKFSVSHTLFLSDVYHIMHIVVTKLDVTGHKSIVVNHFWFYMF